MVRGGLLFGDAADLSGAVVIDDSKTVPEESPLFRQCPADVCVPDNKRRALRVRRRCASSTTRVACHGDMNHGVNILPRFQTKPKGSAEEEKYVSWILFRVHPAPNRSLGATGNWLMQDWKRRGIVFASIRLIRKRPLWFGETHGFSASREEPGCTCSGGRERCTFQRCGNGDGSWVRCNTSLQR
jgi:hypothetical protein